MTSEKPILGQLKLHCSHMGDVVRKSSDGIHIAVKGSNRKCSVCGKISIIEYGGSTTRLIENGKSPIRVIKHGKKRKEWNPTVYIMHLEAQL